MRPFALRSHASERQIVDLADVDASLSIIPTGQSGQPLSGHWRDQTELWARGDYKPMEARLISNAPALVVITMMTWRKSALRPLLSVSVP